MEVQVDGRSPRPELETVAFPVLKLVSEARNEHGMRQQDWRRYRYVTPTYPANIVRKKPTGSARHCA